MITVFQGETGGTIQFNYTDINAVSGYMTLITTSRAVYTIDGYTSSGVLSIPKNLLSSLPANKYTGFFQVIDSLDNVWYLNEIELEVEFVPIRE